MAHILAVDDVADLRTVIAEALGRDGHFVRTLAAGADVTEVHCRWADLLLLYLMMPGEDGSATCSRTRALTDALKLFLPGLIVEVDFLGMLVSGGEDYLTIPFRLGVMN